MCTGKVHQTDTGCVLLCNGKVHQTDTGHVMEKYIRLIQDV